MTTLIIGLVLFIGVHLLPSAVPLRRGIINKIGENKYQGLFALTAATGLVLIVYGMILSPVKAVWNPPAWGHSAIVPLMLVAMVLLASPHMKTNIKRLTRHPMLWGVLIWSVAHSFANNEKHSLILFISFAVFAVVAMISATVRGTATQAEKYPLKNDVIVLLAGGVAYAGFLLAHPYLFGVSVF